MHDGFGPSEEPEPRRSPIFVSKLSKYFHFFLFRDKMTDDFSKEFRPSNKDAAEFLREVADAIEDEDQLNLEGEDWKVSQPLSDKVPMRLFSDEEGLEIGFKLLKED